MTKPLREAHDRLDETSADVVREITNLAATMKVLESADEHAIETALESSAATLSALADLLEEVSGALDRARRGELSGGTLLGLVRELEPPTSAAADVPPPDAAGSEADARGNPFDDVTPLRRLSAPYSVLLNLERDLYAERTRRPYRVRKLKTIWGDLSRIGSSHPSEGLVARLNRFTEYLEEALDGRDVDAPWSDEAVESVRALAERCETIGGWDEATLAEHEQRTWLERVGDWVETVEEEPGSVAHLSEMLTRFLTDRPRTGSPKVTAVLERIAELEDLPDDLGSRVERALESYQ